MSSPRSVGGSVREGTRVVLREITASLHNSPPTQQPLRRKSGNESSSAKTAEHEVKVRFAREFADVGSVTYSAPESLSSASSFQSLSSTLSTKSSSGICPDSSPHSPNQVSNASYVNTSIPGVDDLILGCAEIRLNSEEEQSFSEFQNSQDLSQDQTFASATDDFIVDISRNLEGETFLEDSQNVSLILEDGSTTQESTRSSLYLTNDIQERPILGTICIRDPLPVVPVRNNSLLNADESKQQSVSPNTSCIDLTNDTENCSFTNDAEQLLLPPSGVEESNLNSTVCLSPAKAAPDEEKPEESIPLENTSVQAPLSPNFGPIEVISSVSLTVSSAENDTVLSLPSISTLCSLTIDPAVKLSESDVTDNVKSPLDLSSSPVNKSNVEVPASPQNVLSPIQELSNQSSNHAEIFFCDDPNDVENSLLNVTPVLVPKSPEPLENLETSISNETESINVVVNNVELSPVKSDSLEVNTSAGKQGDTCSAVENKLDVSLEAGIETVEKAEAVNSTNEDEEVREQSSDDKLDSTLTLQDVSLTSETVPEAEQYTEFQPKRQSTTLAPTAEVEQYTEFQPKRQSTTLDPTAEVEQYTEFQPQRQSTTLAPTAEVEPHTEFQPQRQSTALAPTAEVEQYTEFQQQRQSTALAPTAEVEQYTEFQPQRQSTALAPTAEVEQYTEFQQQRQSTALAPTAEVEQYTEFQPQRQSTALAPTAEVEQYTEFQPQRQSTALAPTAEVEQYTEFQPQRQSTALALAPEVNLYTEFQPQRQSIALALAPEVNLYTEFQPQRQSIALALAPEVNLYTDFQPQRQSTALALAPEVNLYTEFQPQRQSTTLALAQEVNLYTECQPQRQSIALALPPIEQPNFEELQSAAEQVANDIFKSSLEISEDNDRFVTATSEIFQDPTSFDFLIAHGNTKTFNRLRTESLYVKFDPLVGDISMLPQGNTPPMNEEQNGKIESSPTPNIDTPKRNPAIAAIDRLLFYSPIPPANTIQKKEEPLEKIEQVTEEPKSNTPVISEVNVCKELELVRATVLQLEEELEKQKKEYEADLERQKNAFQEKITKFQAQIAQEVKSKSQMTVVVDEYEKSISRLLTERERDRTNFEQEKAKLQEELQTTNHHLTNTEDAFNDVHQKYERLKGVVSAYKNNEAVLKESIQENMETIKGLESRYDHLKNHAMTQLEKANFELDALRKQHEDETVKLHALVRKAELKSNSLAELVEQKTKENKELTQILDEVIARVGHQNTE